MGAFYRFIKRLFDIVSSALGLIVTSPIWLIAVIGIELSDPGLVFYIAKRIGKDNRQFKLLKFRSMRVDKGADEKSLRPDQNRIFAWGQFMRSTKIDELPQLLNVFVGSMSVIGPRPASVDQAEITRGGRYAEINRVKPGLSGPSALYDYIYGDRITDESTYTQLVLPTRLQLDLYYLQARSCRFDFKMILWTLISILAPKRRPRMLEQLKTWAETVN